MENLNLEVLVRNEKSNKVRGRGFIPAIVYGQGIEPINIEVDKNKYTSLFTKGTNKNALISLVVKDAKKPLTISVLAHNLQVDFMTDQVIHIDFLKINMQEEIKTKVAIEFIGESEGVKLEGGILVHSLRQLEVKCLPGNIPDKITVDVSPLKIGESIKVSDIILPQGVTVITPKDEPVAIVSAPAEEEAAPVAATEVAVEVGAADQAAGEPGAGGDAVPADAKGKQPVPADTKGKQPAPDDAKGKAPQKSQK
ncbi:MAG: 50S ribosomal protein L25 [Candidatus Margulisiibacteriota bacterium]